MALAVSRESAAAPRSVPARPDREIRVTQISTTDVVGGAARAMQRLHGGLADAGVRSRLLVAQRFGSDPAVHQYNALAPAPAAFGQFYFRATRRWNRPPVRQAGAYLSPDRTMAGWRLLAQVPECDVVNLHWVTDFLDFRTLPALTRRYPVVWTLHDMNAFTGGCHYTGSCERFRETCGACPQLATSTGESDFTRQVMRRKQGVMGRISRARFFVVTPSRWLAQQAGRSSLFRGFPIRVIPNGIDPVEFQPVDRTEGRRRFGLPPDAKIVLFVADSIEEPRKGFKLLLDAFAHLRDIPNLLLVTLGRGQGPALAGLPSRHLGSLPDAESLGLAYGAADVFAIPSLQDNLPNTILESMACGTPVVGFATGGIGEAVADGQAGILAPPGDTAAFSRALRAILANPRLRQTLSAGARLRAVDEYGVRLQAQRYAELYREIVQAPG
jgi:glycosyltransferase involved in cell wall biosynthesis